MPSAALSHQQLFEQLFALHTEGQLDDFIAGHADIFKQENWYPLGGHENNYGVIENQQASPIAALIEKITNSIDATLMKKCYEAGIDPRSAAAPKTMDEAREKFSHQCFNGSRDFANRGPPRDRRHHENQIWPVSGGGYPLHHRDAAAGRSRNVGRVHYGIQ